MNTNAHTFEVAPVFLIVERALIEYTIRKLGWSQGGDGITAPGGSLANMYGLMLARHNLYPDIKTKGIASTQTKPLAIFTSEDRYSYYFNFPRGVKNQESKLIHNVSTY